MSKINLKMSLNDAKIENNKSRDHFDNVSLEIINICPSP